MGEAGAGIQKRNVTTQWTNGTVQGSLGSTVANLLVAGASNMLVDLIILTNNVSGTKTVTLRLIQSGVTPAPPAQDFISAETLAAAGTLTTSRIVLGTPGGGPGGAAGLFTLFDGDAIAGLCATATDVNYIISYRIER